jgi:hypothetical protein
MLSFLSTLHSFLSKLEIIKYQTGDKASILGRNDLFIFNFSKLSHVVKLPL